MERKKQIENCELQIANCKLSDTSVRPPFKFSIFNFQFSIFNSPLRRRGFTLVEILVVITIIGLLVALLLPAIGAAQRAARKATVKLEMEQIIIAIESVKTNIGGGQYPPDGTNNADIALFMNAAYPRCPSSNWPTQFKNTGTTQNNTLTPLTALVFWLGGAQDAQGNFIGFSANPQNPFDASASRIAPAFDFGKGATNAQLLATGGSLTGGGVPVPSASTVYWNMFQVAPKNGLAQGVSAPYLYFKAVANSYTYGAINTATAVAITTVTPNQVTMPYGDSTVGGQAFVNPKTYQLLCPGLDGKYGNYPTNNTTYSPIINSYPIASCPQYPSGSNYDAVNGQDDMNNFTKGSTVADDATN